MSCPVQCPSLQSLPQMKKYCQRYNWPELKVKYFYQRNCSYTWTAEYQSVINIELNTNISVYKHQQQLPYYLTSPFIRHSWTLQLLKSLGLIRLESDKKDGMNIESISKFEISSWYSPRFKELSVDLVALYTVGTATDIDLACRRGLPLIRELLHILRRKRQRWGPQAGLPLMDPGNPAIIEPWWRVFCSC